MENRQCLGCGLCLYEDQVATVCFLRKPLHFCVPCLKALEIGLLHCRPPSQTEEERAHEETLRVLASRMGS